MFLLGNYEPVKMTLAFRFYFILNENATVGVVVTGDSAVRLRCVVVNLICNLVSGKFQLSVNFT